MRGAHSSSRRVVSAPRAPLQRARALATALTVVAKRIGEVPVAVAAARRQPPSRRLLRLSSAPHLAESCLSCPLPGAMACGSLGGGGGDTKNDPEAAAVQPAAGDEWHAEAGGGGLDAVAVA